MDDMAHFELGYLMGKKHAPAAASPLSLEGIKALKTIATISYGSFVYEVKEPYKFLAGAIGSVSSDSGQHLTAWQVSAVINGSVAAIGQSSLAQDEESWGNWIINNSPQNYYYKKWSEFTITSINADSVSGGLPAFRTGFSGKITSGYGGLEGYTESVTGLSAVVSAEYPTYMVFTNLNQHDYLEFVKAFCSEAMGKTPVINIL